ncbi:MAG TPA: hypothetical protein VN763_04930 [Saprospiraceae bacterium]|nr:hypothetical protein [Saprospiraceae bacterium]
MKYLFTLLIGLLGLNLHSQTGIIASENGGSFASADKISFNTEMDIYELSGNVSFNDELIKIKGADKVTFNSKKKVVTATGGAGMDASIDGEIIYQEKCTPEHTLYYRLGKKKLFINKDCH